METANTVKASKITLSELMLPSHSNFSGKIHGGYLLKLMERMTKMIVMILYKSRRKRNEII